MGDTQRAALYVEKGGVGKTTSAAHLAVAAARDHDRDVILLDLAGTQNDLAAQFGLSERVDEIDAPISAVFGDDWEFIEQNMPDIVERMVFETDEGVDLIPADPGLGAADNNLANVALEERYTKLQAFVAGHLADRYDLVLFDLPGKEDNIALNGLFAAENVVAPLKPGEFERTQLEKLDATLAEIGGDFDDTDPRLALVFATMVERTTNLASAFTDDLEDEYPDVIGEAVANSANIGAGQTDGRTLFAFDEDELYETGKRAREAYRQNTDLLLTRL